MRSDNEWDAFNLGYLSYIENVPRKDCPYENPYLQDAWIEGWYAAKRDEDEYTMSTGGE